MKQFASCLPCHQYSLGLKGIKLLTSLIITPKFDWLLQRGVKLLFSILNSIYEQIALNLISEFHTTEIPKVNATMKNPMRDSDHEAKSSCSHLIDLILTFCSPVNVLLG